MIYIAILIVLGLVAIFEYSYKFEDYAQLDISVNKFIIVKRAFYSLSAAFLIIMAGFRFETGFDYTNYVRIFNRAAHGQRYLGVEKTYYYWNAYMHKLTDNYMWIFFLMALVTLGIKFLFIERINKFMKNTILFSFFIYFSMYFLIYDMGQIRSSFAQAMGILTMFLYLKGYKKLSIIPILIGMTIHNSCVILLLIYIIGERRYKIRTMVIIYVVFLVIGQFINLDNIGNVVSVIGNQALTKKFTEYTTNPMFAQKIGLSMNLLFQAFVLFGAIFMRWYYKIQDKKLDFMLNLYLVGASLYLLFNNYFVLGVRLSAYFNLAILFIVPKLVSQIKNRWLRMAVVLGFVIIMSIMVIRELQVNTTIFLPYKINLFNHIYEIR